MGVFPDQNRNVVYLFSQVSWSRLEVDRVLTSEGFHCVDPVNEVNAIARGRRNHNHSLCL